MRGSLPGLEWMLLGQSADSAQKRRAYMSLLGATVLGHRPKAEAFEPWLWELVAWCVDLRVYASLLMRLAPWPMGQGPGAELQRIGSVVSLFLQAAVVQRKVVSSVL